MTAEKKEYNVLLMISKRGYRHTPLEQKFVSYQIDWIYSSATKTLARIARECMEFAMCQNLKIDRAERPVAPDTSILFSNDGTRKHQAIETMRCDGFQISLEQSSDTDVQETNGVVSGELKTASCEVVSGYLRTIAETRMNSIMSTGGSLGEIMVKIANAIDSAGETIIPLFMTNEMSDSKNEFSLVLAPNEKDPEYMLRFKFTFK